VAAAALTYFNKSLDELTLGEAAFLASLPKAPNRYNPTRYPQIAKARRDWVLDRMVEDGVATQGEVSQAEALLLEPRHRQATEEVRAPYFAEEVRRELLARYGEHSVYGSGLSVRTSLDAGLQAAADEALRTGLIRYERGHGGWRGAVDRIDPKGNWQARLAKVPVPAVATDVGWQLAVVTRSDKDGATIGLKGGATGRIPFSDMHWARPRRNNGSFGSYPRTAADVVKPGDVVMVEPTKRRLEERRSVARRQHPMHCVKCRRYRARSSPWTRTAVGCSRSVAGSVSRSASSTAPLKPNGNQDRRSSRLYT